MTNEEAIKTIEIAIAEVEWNYPMDYAIAFENAISALEKQIPKKPSETDKARCIHCACVVKRDERFCKNCGQALDFNSNGSDTE